MAAKASAKRVATVRSPRPAPGASARAPERLRRDTVKPVAARSGASRVGLSASHYTSSTVYAREQQFLFARGWVALCREDELSEPGGFVATQLFDEPVVVVRGKDHRVRVLSNVCRHRGMLLAEGTGCVSRLQCPYHAWTYGLDGKLLGAPLMRDQVAKRNCDLPEFGVWCWGGFVFANADRKVRPPRMTVLDQQIGRYGFEHFHLIDVFEEEWPCNWKCLVENFMDAYHLSVVHPGTLRPLTPSHLSRKSVSGKAFTSYIANYTETAPLRRNHAAELSDAERRQSQLFCVYPFLIASVSADTLAFLMLQPNGVDSVRVRWGLSSFEARLSRGAARTRVKKWQAINQEDHAVLARLQHGLRSRVYRPGPLAPPDLEGSVADFHRWYRGALKK